MSNKYLLFLSFSLIFFQLQAGLVPHDSLSVDSMLKEADHLYAYELYDEALPLYESLFEREEYSEQMLYRLAYMHEQSGEYAHSIFFLKKILRVYGGQRVKLKIQDLYEQMGYSPPRKVVSGISSIHSLIEQYLVVWVAIMFVLTLIAARYIVISRAKMGLLGGILLLLIPLVIGLAIVHKHYISPKHMVIVQSGLLYDEPSYAGTPLKNTILPGSTVSVINEQDIWFEVKDGGRKGWIPNFAVRQL